MSRLRDLARPVSLDEAVTLLEGAIIWKMEFVWDTCFPFPTGGEPWQPPLFDPEGPWLRQA